MNRSLLQLSGVAVATLVLAACSSSSDSKSSGTGGVGGSGAGGSGGISLGGSGGDSGVSLGGTGAATGGGPGDGGKTLIYAHTDTTLYQLDPNDPSLPLTEIGTFDCVPSKTTAMTDVAVNAQGSLWSVSAHAIWQLQIDGTTVKCAQEIPLQDPAVRFYALTFAPAGVLATNDEILVAGNSAGEVWSVDQAGKVTQHGAFGPVPANDGNGHNYANAGKAWELSGDMVFLANNGNPVGFATVRDCPNPPDTAGCNSQNTLIEIDVKKLGSAAPTDIVTKSVRGLIVTAPTCSDGKNGYYGNLYGIASWNAHLYGFSRSGNLVDIALQDGTACLVQSYPNATGGFSGAGVTTVAPIIPPTPK